MLRNSLRNTSFSATKGSWNSACTTLHSWEESIQYTLTCQKRCLSSKFFSDWTSLTHGPEMAHVNLFLFLFEFNDNNRLTHCILSLGEYFLYTTVNLGWNHDSVLSEKIILEHISKNITCWNKISDLVISIGSEIPCLMLVEAWYINSTGHENRWWETSNGLKWTLNSIEYRV
jgi:hypothetical protein